MIICWRGVSGLAVYGGAHALFAFRWHRVCIVFQGRLIIPAGLGGFAGVRVARRNF